MKNMNKLYITSDVYLECCWGELSLYYTEHSPDPWYSDRETEVDIDKDMALKVIEYLKQAYDV